MNETWAGRRILVLDDDAGVVDFLCESLDEHGYETVGMTSPTEALERITREHFDLLVSDVEMPELRGLDLLQAVLARRPSQLVLLITAFGTIEMAVSAVKAGACDFVAKPFKLEVLLLAIERAFTDQQLRREIVRLRTTRPSQGPGQLVAEGPAMRKVVETARRAAQSRATVLLCGEPGAGKSVLARFVHAAGGDAARPFVEIDCATLPPDLAGERLFGAEGEPDAAGAGRGGAFAAAGGGTLLLDGISELPFGVQARLRDALESGAGQADAAPRLIVATSRPLEALLREGRVRPDLYYHLNVIRIDLPPLRERREDVVALVDHFLGRAASRREDRGREIVGVSAAAMRRLVHHDWPGNVRELANVLERAVALAQHDSILPEDIELGAPSAIVAGAEGGPDGIVPLDQIERAYVRQVLDATGGNKAAAARALGINRRTLYRKIYG
ncbi:MAG: sigma-54-dependent Fis family transcriptional regulator [bacterium]|nr:sigma-54-dependent Fis family transcriptional regulator [bacterium]